MPTTTKNINVLSLSDVKTPLENQIYNADSQNWIWRNGEWNVVIDISNVNDLSKVKPRIYANGLEQPTVFFKNGKEYNPLGGSNTSSVVNSTPNTTKNYSDEIYAFQKWLRDTYGNAVDLGNSGEKKDGVDGVFGKKTKPLWDKYKDEYGNATNLDVNNTPHEDKEIAPRESSFLTRNPLSKSIHGGSAIDDLYARSSENYNKLNTAKDLADSKMLRNRGIADMLPTAIGGAYGLGQLAKGKKLSKNLKPPKRVEQLLPNQQLSTLLAQSAQGANMIDPRIKENALRDITTNRELANEVARVANAGDITGYAQNVQNNYLRSNDAVRKLAFDQSADLQRKQQAYANLVDAKMVEDRNLYLDKLHEFENVDYPEFKGARQYAANLTNTGMENFMGALNNGVANAPLLQGYNNIMSGYKARYASMSPAEKKAFAQSYPKLARKYQMEMNPTEQVDVTTVQPIATTKTAIQPQELPQMPLSYHLRF